MKRPAAWVALIAFVAYAALVHAGPAELLRSIGGLVALWGPLAVLLFTALRRNVPDFVPRAALAATGSYALTTAAYFGCCVIWSPALFSILHGLAAAAAVATALVNRRPIAAAWRDRRIDWTLVAVVALTLVAFSRYQLPYDVDPHTRDVGLATFPDQTYFCAQAYELARHTPPVQQACQAGLPERAYHLFPHLAAMLAARFTGEPDMMRAHFFSDYATLAVLTCLSLYAIASRLAASRVAGYIAAASLVIFAIPMPAIGGGSPAYLGFTLFPLATSLTEPAFITSPQTFSGLAVTFGLLAGVVQLCQRLRDGLPLGALAMFCGLLTAATLRFRAQVFIPLFPEFLLLLAYAYRRTRRRSLLAAIAVTVAVAVLLYVEMRSPVYLRDTAAVVVGFHPNFRPFMDTWPFADALRAKLFPASTSGADAGPAWQTLSILLFTTLNVIGLPLLIATIFWLRRRRDAWRQWGGYTALTLWLVAASVAGSLFLTSAFDPYSVGGQMLLNTGWYLLPLLAVGAWQLITWLTRHTTWSPRTRAALAWSLLLAATLTQATRGLSALERYDWKHGVVLTWNEWLAIRFLHDHTPADAVILANGTIEPERDWAVIPGLAGRASYLTYTNTLSLLPRTAAAAAATPSRPDVLAELWHTTSPDRFADLLARTGADYLVEFSNRPLALAPPPPDLLREVWASPPGNIVRVRIFQILESTP